VHSAYRDVVEQFDNKHALEYLHAFNLVFPHGALDQTPRIVELGLHRDVALGYLLLVL
jgi:hypothetical protein